MNQDNKRIAQFLFEVGTMRKLLRSHRQLLLTDDLSDNIASHSYRVALIGWILATRAGVDAYKVLLMCLLHDLAEVRTNDHKVIQNLSDGVHYFSLQIRTPEGWSRVAQYRMNIDTTPPSPFSVTFPHGNKTTEPQPIILFNTEDSISGVNTYQVKIGTDGLVRFAPPAESNPYPLPPQTPGTHIVTVTAIDAAGNTTSASGDFIIEAIKPPTITEYPEEMESEDILKVRGITYPNAEVFISVWKDNDLIVEEYTKSNLIGDFAVVVTKRLRGGEYIVTARVKDDRGAESGEGDAIRIVVTRRIFAGIVENSLYYLSLIILAGIVFFGLWGGLLWARRVCVPFVYRKKRNPDSQSLKIALDLLRSDLSEHIKTLKTVKNERELSPEEIAFLERFEGKLAQTENLFISISEKDG